MTFVLCLPKILNRGFYTVLNNYLYDVFVEMLETFTEVEVLDGEIYACEQCNGKLICRGYCTGMVEYHNYFSYERRK